MKRRALILAGVVGLCSTLAPGLSLAWPAKVAGVPGYGECLADAKRAGIPRVKNLPYDAARRKVIAYGWQPKVTMADKWKNGQVTLFWERGDTEIGNCAEDRGVSCRFNFVDKFGNWLVVFTHGEESQKFHAAVVYAGLLCPEK